VREVCTEGEGWRLGIMRMEEEEEGWEEKGEEMCLGGWMHCRVAWTC